MDETGSAFELGASGAGRWLEELTPGSTIRHRITRTVTEFDNVLFTTMTMNPQPLHLDAEFARSTEFGAPLVNSLYTLALAVGLTVADTTLRTTVANLGFESIAFPAPVFHGDTIRAETEVVEVRPSASRTNAGVVLFEHRGYNQHDALVVRARRSALILRQPQPTGE